MSKYSPKNLGHDRPVRTILIRAFATAYQSAAAVLIAFLASGEPFSESVLIAAGIGVLASLLSLGQRMSQRWLAEHPE